MKWYNLIIICAAFITLMLVATNKHLRMRSCIYDYQHAATPTGRTLCVVRGQMFMNTRLLPYVLDRYRDDRDVQFTVSMIAKCQSGEANRILWDKAVSSPPGSQIRVVCMAALLTRNQFKAWGEITDEDIEMIAVSMPVHIVHWRQILLKYSGAPMRSLAKDSYPERHKFKALFRECLEKYKAQETLRMMRDMDSGFPAVPAVQSSGAGTPLSDTDGMARLVARTPRRAA